MIYLLLTFFHVSLTFRLTEQGQSEELGVQSHSAPMSFLSHIALSYLSHSVPLSFFLSYIVHLHSLRPIVYPILLSAPEYNHCSSISLSFHTHTKLDGSMHIQSQTRAKQRIKARCFSFIFSSPAIRPAVHEQLFTGSAHRATFQCLINAMNTSRLFYKLAPASNGRNEPDLH